MKYTFLVAVFLFSCIICKAQLNVKQAIGSIDGLNLPDPKQPIYEDNKYVVRRTCSGEWGGTVWFKNKKTGIEYVCEAVCPISVNKIDDIYYVTSTLMHLIGFSNVSEIRDPDLMEVFVLHPVSKVKGKRVRYAGETESGSMKGVTKLAESTQKIILGSFVSNGVLYHLMSSYKEVYVASIKDGEFVKILQVFEDGTSPLHIPFMRGNELIIPFIVTDNDLKGYFRVVGETITVVKPKT